MRSPSSGSTYHVVHFDHAAEAAAFIAALSRFLDAPGGGGFVTGPPPAAGPVEVWSYPTVPGDSVEVYLSGGALE
ncbi:MAG TPA: hypothetical protein VKA84_20130, partial [Gemmatimonadaceae bacterium]|nr:hypothetical protein [Gemmatimonadaceae bacterium]